MTAVSNIFSTAKELSRRADSSKCPVAKRNGSQWVQYGDHCYSAEQALYSFSEAKQLCQELGKLKIHLVSFE